ncbi:MAG: hypothetical protein VXZ72_02405, partial [Chlamydiota bacterium]|nr:hypothetical protein [Chlamydiota bacterium]
MNEVQLSEIKLDNIDTEKTKGREKIVTGLFLSCLLATTAVGLLAYPKIIPLYSLAIPGGVALITGIALFQLGKRKNKGDQEGQQNLESGTNNANPNDQIQNNPNDQIQNNQKDNEKEISKLQNEIQEQQNGIQKQQQIIDILKRQGQGQQDDQIQNNPNDQIGKNKGEQEGQGQGQQDDQIQNNQQDYDQSQFSGPKTLIQ